MKKNFLKVAALLIAAMLMVVSCTQEVAPVNNGLVETNIGLAYGKDVTIQYADDANIKYQYKLTALFTQLENGAPVYGETNGFVDAHDSNKTFKIGASVTSFNSNYVTPGYWKIDVQGLVNDTVVLKGSTKAYFSGSQTSATVYVSPATDATAVGDVTITLLMEDLDKDDADDAKDSKIMYYLDSDTTGKTVTKVAKENTSEDNKQYVDDYAAHEYSIVINNVTAGYHTITFKVNGFEGGVTKSFLMIPGNDVTISGSEVTISGSIYPSKFVDSSSSITVVSLGQNIITVGENTAAVKFDGVDDDLATFDYGTTSIKVSIEEFKNPITDDATGITYEWYIDGVAVENSNKNTLDITSLTLPGDYTVTCIAKLSYTDDTIGQVTVYGDSAYAGKIRIKAASNK